MLLTMQEIAMMRVSHGESDEEPCSGLQRTYSPLVAVLNHENELNRAVAAGTAAAAMDSDAESFSFDMDDINSDGEQAAGSDWRQKSMSRVESWMIEEDVPLASLLKQHRDSNQVKRAKLEAE